MGVLVDGPKGGNPILICVLDCFDYDDIVSCPLIPYKPYLESA